jgi:hypothetical protein
MFGFLLAVLYVGFMVIAFNTDATTAGANTLPVLWWWHIAWTIIIFLFSLLIPLLGLIALVFANDGKAKACGAGLILFYPFMLVALLLSAALFLGGIYLVEGAISWENGVATITDTSHAVTGAVMYGAGVLLQLFRRAASKSNSNK